LGKNPPKKQERKKGKREKGKSEKEDAGPPPKLAHEEHHGTLRKTKKKGTKKKKGRVCKSFKKQKKIRDVGVEAKKQGGEKKNSKGGVPKKVGAKRVIRPEDRGKRYKKGG